jgi:hypothetical protein
MTSKTIRRALATVTTALAGMLTLSAQPALAWGELGHRTVGEIAYANVKPETRAQIDELLKNADAMGTPLCTLKNLSDAATYPDCLHAYQWRFAYTFAFHYQDIDVDKPFDIKEGCANTICVTQQIERDRRILADRSLNAPTRMEALIFLTHFVGDLHQPLHAAEHEHDAGGNAVTVTNVPAPNYMAAGKLVDNSAKPANLHSVWDTVVVERAQALGHLPPVRAYSDADKAKIAGGEVADWAQESWSIARDLVYPQAFAHTTSAPGAKPVTVTIDDADLDHDADVAAKRILQGGLRLARVLDEALAPKG